MFRRVSAPSCFRYHHQNFDGADDDQDHDCKVDHDDLDEDDEYDDQDYFD